MQHSRKHFVGSVWSTLEDGGGFERLFRSPWMILETERIFHSLRRRLDRHVFLLSIMGVYEGTVTWREIER